MRPFYHMKNHKNKLSFVLFLGKINSYTCNRKRNFFFSFIKKEVFCGTSFPRHVYKHVKEMFGNRWGIHEELKIFKTFYSSNKDYSLKLYIIDYFISIMGCMCALNWEKFSRKTGDSRTWLKSITIYEYIVPIVEFLMSMRPSKLPKIAYLTNDLKKKKKNDLFKWPH